MACDCEQCMMLGTFKRHMKRIRELEDELDSLKQYIFEQGCGSGEYDEV